MKKFLICVISALLAAVSVFAAACGKDTSFTAPGFGDFGAAETQGSFVCTTDNYVLFINGVATSTDDNSYGAPVKGSLMAIKKADFAAGNYSEAKIIVPKLFAASDYTSGLFVNGDYVYYGTPSTDKDSSGKIANGEIAFMKSKLDGTEKPQQLFKYSSLSVSYRIVSDGDSVYVAYYDSADAALKVYSEKTAATQVIAKTDSTVNDEFGETGTYLSLGEYKFAETNDAAAFAVIYTVTVYDAKYYEEAAAQSGYSRSTANYNYVYAYKAGDGAESGGTLLGKAVLDGSAKNLTYSLKLVKNGYAFYSEKDINSKETVKGAAVKEFADLNKHVEIKNADLVADTTYIESPEKVYAIDSDAKTVYETSLLTDGRAEKHTVIPADESLSSILFKLGDDLYFYNTDNNIVRIKINDAEAETVRVSLGAVNTSWYKPALITVSDKKYLVYCDATTVGSSYSYVADLAADVIGEDIDDDGENDLFYLGGVKVLGKVTAADAANVVADAVSAIPSTLDLEETDGVLKSEKYDNAQKIYDELSDEVKEFVSERDVTKLANCKKAVSLANAYYKLKSVVDYDELSDAEKATLKTDYETAKAARQAIIDEEGEETFKAIRDMIEENIKYYFQQAGKKVEG